VSALRVLWVAALAAALAGGGCAGSSSQPDWLRSFGYAASDAFPIEVGDFGFPRVPVEIAGTRLELAFDTGNQVGLGVSSSVFDRLGLTAHGSYDRLDSAGRLAATLRVAEVREVSFLGRRLGVTSVYEIDEPTLPGLVGPILLGSGHFTLDYGSRMFALGTASIPGRVTGFEPVSMVRSSRHPMLILVRGTIEGRPVLIELDTGKSRTVINPNLAATLAPHVVMRLRIGGRSFEIRRPKEVDQTGIDPTLPEPILVGVGSDVLARFVWTVDYDTSLLWIPARGAESSSARNLARACCAAVRSPHLRKSAGSLWTISVQIQVADGAAAMDPGTAEPRPNRTGPDPARAGAPEGPGRAEERRQAGELARARDAFAACVAELPESLRAAVLGDDEDGPSLGRKWPLGRLEECAAHIAQLELRGADPRVARLVREARRQKAVIDETRTALVLANLGLVSHVARQFAVRGLSFGDLVQEGTIGLITAVERFEVDRGYKFSTYAYWWVRQAISTAVAAESTFLRLPDYARATLRRYREATREVESGEGGDFGAIAKQVGVPSQRLSQLIAAARQPFSLEATVVEDEEEMLRQMPDLRTPSPLAHTLDREMRRRILDAMGRLEPRERTILLHRYGIGDDQRCTLAQLGRMLKITRERVRQIEREALAKILRAGAGTAATASVLRRTLEDGTRIGV